MTPLRTLDFSLKLRSASATHIQWRAPTLDLSTVTDEKHLALLHANTVEQMGIEEFKAFVTKRALAKPAAEAPLRDVPEGSLLNGFVFLDRATEDGKTAEPIIEYLSELKVECKLPRDKGQHRNNSSRS